MSTWLVARRIPHKAEWENIGTTDRTPSPELVSELCRRSHVPRTDAGFFSEEGIEFRFVPVGGGEPVVFRARYQLVVDPTTVDAADAAALPDLDLQERDIP